MVEQRTPEDIYTIGVLDVNHLMPFSKPEGFEASEDFQLKDEVLARTTEFTTTLARKLRSRLISIGEDKAEGRHILRYVFSGREGLLELIIDRPAVLNAYFVKRKDAVAFLHALRATLKQELPPSTVKDLFIDSIHIAKGLEEKITHHAHHKMRAIYLHKGASLVAVAIVIVAIFEVIKAVVGIITVEVLGLGRGHPWLVTVISAVFISFFFDPIRDRIEHFIEKYF
ncbi:hypothetical protein D6789_04260 [Candidatus Woesearchaeota archaeon]|nr:MAG: hypothetical protein D6789_04260 [Candidatus Woesearchaeota archaeon]